MTSQDYTDKVNAVLFDTAAEGLVVVNAVGEIIMANPRANEMFGYETDALIGEKIEVLIPREARNAHVDRREGYMQKPQKRSMGMGMDLNGMHANGIVFPVEVSLNYFITDGEKLVMCLITDITERKKAEQALQELNADLERRVEERTSELRASEQLYSLIARNYPNGTINVFDRDLNYIFAEGQELYKLGVTSSHLMGTNYLKRLPVEVRDTIKEKLMQVFDGTNTNFEIQTNGEFYLIDAVGLADAQGSVQRVLVVEQNITRQKRAEDDMRTALEKEQELNEMKSRFVSMASHEFRTPLSTILSSLSLLMKYKDQPEKQDKHVGRIKSSVHNLTNILNDFLNIDKLEAGKIQARYTPVNVHHLGLDVIEEMKVISKPEQKFIFNHHGEEVMNLDASMLKNITINLLSNASKYSKDDGEIYFDTAIDDHGLTLKVRDQGIGIPLDEQEHLFERFFRAKNATNIQGTGLGLNIVKKYVDLMQGDINFESDEYGTEFKIIVPHN